MNKLAKFTINDLNAKFPDDDACLEYILNLIYPDGVFCKTCDKVTKHYRIRGRKVFSCEFCGTQVSPTSETILHKSPTSLRTWLYAIYLMASTRCGISAKHLQRETGVTYKTAWRMFTQIRKLLQEDGVTLSGTVEVDETYIGGRDKNRHENKRSGKRGRGAAGKTIVGGVVERKGRIVAKVIPDVSADSLLPIIRGHVLPASTVYTDELPSYNRVSRMGYDHKRIHHEAKVYVDGDVHTNTLEGFWSLVKRSLGGAHHAVSGKYLQAYLNEYTFRWNHRDDETPMFLLMVSQIPAVRTSV